MSWKPKPKSFENPNWNKPKHFEKWIQKYIKTTLNFTSYRRLLAYLPRAFFELFLNYSKKISLGILFSIFESIWFHLSSLCRITWKRFFNSIACKNLLSWKMSIFRFCVFQEAFCLKECCPVEVSDGNKILKNSWNEIKCWEKYESRILLTKYSFPWIQKML